VRWSRPFGAAPPNGDGHPPHRERERERRKNRPHRERIRERESNKAEQRSPSGAIAMPTGSKHPPQGKSAPRRTWSRLVMTRDFKTPVNSRSQGDQFDRGRAPPVPVRRRPRESSRTHARRRRRGTAPWQGLGCDRRGPQPTFCFTRVGAVIANACTTSAARHPPWQGLGCDRRGP
jgi:hypothetical protein